MLRTLLRRSAIGVLGLVAVVSSVLGTQATEVSAQDIFSRVGCSYGDYACYYSRAGAVTQGYPTVYQPFGYTVSTVNYTPTFYNTSFAPATSGNTYIAPFNTYAPAFYNNSLFFNGSYYPSYYSNRTYFGYNFGGVPDRFFRSVGCNVGNYTCLYNRT